MNNLNKIEKWYLAFALCALALCIWLILSTAAGCASRPGVPPVLPAPTTAQNGSLFAKTPMKVQIPHRAVFAKAIRSPASGHLAFTNFALSWLGSYDNGSGQYLVYSGADKRLETLWCVVQLRTNNGAWSVLLITDHSPALFSCAAPAAQFRARLYFQ